MKKSDNNISIGLKTIHNWFTSKSWTPFPFQIEVWEAVLSGHSGLLNSPTGSGKTFALLFPALIKELSSQPITKQKHKLKLIWITPLRALAKDLQKTFIQTCSELNLNWKVGIRTGDISSAEKAKQQRSMPEILIITPESLHILFAQKNNPNYFQNTEFIVVDEWHELLGSKRGILTQLAIAQIKQYTKKLSVWGISATIENLDEALNALVWCNRNEDKKPKTVVNPEEIRLDFHTIIPDEIERFPWSGHLGLKTVPKVIDVLNEHKTTLIFTNTRTQCELWYQNLLNFDPDLAGQMAMHHSSIDPDIRNWIEDAIKDGKLKVVVCTSTLDLGVDFHPVETVIQIGSPKGVARFLQRAGRSGHQPNERSKVYMVPTHAIELLESVALNYAIKQNEIESRDPYLDTFDLALQFLTTLATGAGLYPDRAWEVIQDCYSFKHMEKEEFDEIIQFLQTGGKALKQYDDYQKIIPIDDHFEIANRKFAQRHRLSIGAIISDTAIRIKFISGGSIGSVEEYFISSLQIGDTFWFAGRCLELVQFKENTAFVKTSKSKKGVVASWMGGRMQLSSKLSSSLQYVLKNYQSMDKEYPTIEALEPLLSIQNDWSAIPDSSKLLFEYSISREGHHLFCYPLEGRYVHEGLASLFAYRISKIKPISFSLAMNDYGFELLSDQEIPINEALAQGLLSLKDIEKDLFKSINETEMVRRRFREIAQLGGLLFLGFPGSKKKDRHLQSSSGLLFEVFKKYDSENPLLIQARREVLEKQLELNRLMNAIKNLEKKEVLLTYPKRFTPFAFPILTDRLREKMSSEKLSDRIKRMQIQLNKAADKQGYSGINYSN